MAKRETPKNQRPTNVIALPPRGSIPDVRRLLVEGQSTPTVKLPPNLEKAVQERAMALSKEAYELCLEHLRRRVAFNGECGWPERVLNLPSASRALMEGGLAHALTREWHLELERIERDACMLTDSTQKLLADVRATIRGA